MASSMLARGTSGTCSAARRAGSQAPRQLSCTAYPVHRLPQTAATPGPSPACAIGPDVGSAGAAVLPPHQTQRQQQRGRLSRPLRATAAPAVTASVDEQPWGPSELAADVADMIAYAIKLAWTSETYEVHSWMLLLGVLKHEGCTAAGVLKSLGLEDLYGAWHEVLWALNVSDGLEPRAFTHNMAWGRRAYRLLHGAMRFAGWAGRSKVQSEDLLLAFAADSVLTDLFPDLDLSFDRVKSGIEKATGVKYELPGYEQEGGALASSDMFL